MNFEPDEYFNRVINGIVGDAVADARCVVPGKVGEVTRAADGERDINFQPGIARRQGGELVGDGPVAAAPVLSLGGGGWSVLLPLLEGDEALGLAVDRNSQRWRQNREVGDAHSQIRSHNVSDVFALPFTITAADGAPSDPGADFVISNRAERLRIEEGGAITITKVSDGGAPTPVATISLDAGGSITLEVQGGQSVNVGGPAATALAKAQQLLTALDAAVTAAVAAAIPIVPPAGDGGTAAFSAFQSAWNASKNAIATQKAKGE